MRFHGLLLVRDEDDIVEEMLRHAFTWIDTVWVLDTGSTDDTYAVLEDLARTFSGLRLLGRHEVVFDQSLRAYLFAEARRTFADGDWVVKLDADEFYHVPPPAFVRNVVAPGEGAIDLHWYYFRLTAEEAALYERGGIDLAADRRRPIAERRRFYKLPSHREPRMFRYRPSMRFAHTDSAPAFAGLTCPRPIPVRHYPHRDPQQMEKRFALRRRMLALGSCESRHWAEADWRSDLVPEAGGATERGGLATQPGHTDGALLYAPPGTALPDALAPAGTATHWTRRLFYRGPVRLFDRVRPGFAAPDLLERRRIAPGPEAGASSP